jgi:hypothetical protein
MKLKPFFALLSLMLSAFVLPITAARADTLYDAASFVQGGQSFVQSFNITTPGTLTVTLTDIPWLDTVSNLTGFLTTTAGVMGTTFGGGSESFSIGAGTVYAHWFGEANGAYDIGVLGVKIVFQPNGVTPVPIPASLILLLSGLGVLFGWQHRAAPSSAATPGPTAA